MQGGGSVSGDEFSDSLCILKVEPVGFTDELYEECKRKRSQE